MIASEKYRQYLSEYIKFLSKNNWKSIKRIFFSSEKIRNLGKYIYDYAHSFLGVDFYSNALYWLRVSERFLTAYISGTKRLKNLENMNICTRFYITTYQNLRLFLVNDMLTTCKIFNINSKIWNWSTEFDD